MARHDFGRREFLLGLSSGIDLGHDDFIGILEGAAEILEKCLVSANRCAAARRPRGAALGNALCAAASVALISVG